VSGNDGLGGLQWLKHRRDRPRAPNELIVTHLLRWSVGNQSKSSAQVVGLFSRDSSYPLRKSALRCFHFRESWPSGRCLYTACCSFSLGPPSGWIRHANTWYGLEPFSASITKACFIARILEPPPTCLKDAYCAAPTWVASSTQVATALATSCVRSTVGWMTRPPRRDLGSRYERKHSYATEYHSPGRMQRVTCRRRVVERLVIGSQRSR
jgi:hypothetical protein